MKQIQKAILFGILKIMFTITLGPHPSTADNAYWQGVKSRSSMAIELSLHNGEIRLELAV